MLWCMWLLLCRVTQLFYFESNLPCHLACEYLMSSRLVITFWICIDMSCCKWILSCHGTSSPWIETNLLCHVTSECCHIMSSCYHVLKRIVMSCCMWILPCYVISLKCFEFGLLCPTTCCHVMSFHCHVLNMYCHFMAFVIMPTFWICHVVNTSCHFLKSRLNFTSKLTATYTQTHSQSNGVVPLHMIKWPC